MSEQIQYFNSYIDRYGEKEGRCNFLTLCEFMIETEPFPNNLDWCEIQRMVINNEI